MSWTLWWVMQAVIVDDANLRESNIKKKEHEMLEKYQGAEK